MTGATSNNVAAARVQAMKEICQRPNRSISYPTDKDGSPTKLSELFGCNVYGLKQLRTTLPKPVYADLLRQMTGNKIMDKPTADAVAHAVKVWAMGRGATHFTHWFQPLTNSTAEKHDSFLTLAYSTEGGNLSVIALDAFSGSQLVQAEPDASSFPNGGMRTTFEARGYTVWDTASPMFLQEGPHGTKILYIPSIFISYNGEALDEKTILLRSCDAVSNATLDLLKVLGDKETEKVHVTLGTEQEFFLVDRGLYSLRPDLKMTGRTLFGSVPAKHQQLEDHYFAYIPSKVLAAISEAELELWRLGVPVKTRHNEVAPQQFEMAPVFEEASVAVDHNLLTMHVLHRVAHRHGLRALFHEKPFKGVNGSGKHCNWSMSTDTGKNLLDPTDKPEENFTFLLILVAILQGVKSHSGLLSASIMSASNEHRLGANEAPPSIISAFLGAQLNEVLDSIAENRPTRYDMMTEKSVNVGATTLNVKVAHLPQISRDATDRNRTSPFAFTGNKFEFRAVGSSQSPSFPVSMVNAATASSIRHITGLLKEKKGSKDKLSQTDIIGVIQQVIGETKDIRFEGDGYSQRWVQEAAHRGLPNFRDAPAAFKELLAPHNKGVLIKKLDIFNENELLSRFNILNLKYVKDMLIESKTLINMCVQNFLPALFNYRRDLASGIAVIASQSTGALREKKLLDLLNTKSELLYSKVDSMNLAIENTEQHLEGHGGDVAAAANTSASQLKPIMEEIRAITDEIEAHLADEHYPMPKYSEILFC